MPSEETKPDYTSVLAVRTLHEATLQDLLHARNDAVFKLIHKRNELLRERYFASWFESSQAFFVLIYLFCPLLEGTTAWYCH